MSLSRCPESSLGGWGVWWACCANTLTVELVHEVNGSLVSVTFLSADAVSDSSVRLRLRLSSPAPLQVWGGGAPLGPTLPAPKEADEKGEYEFELAGLAPSTDYSLRVLINTTDGTPEFSNTLNVKTFAAGKLHEGYFGFNDVLIFRLLMNCRRIH